MAKTNTKNEKGFDSDLKTGVRGGRGGTIYPPKKGEVRNPKGNNGAKLSGFIKSAFAEEVTKDKDGEGVTAYEAAALEVRRLFFDKHTDPRLKLEILKFIADRTEGRPIQAVVTSDSQAEAERKLGAWLEDEEIEND